MKHDAAQNADYLLGLSLGPAHDFTALAVLERPPLADGQAIQKDAVYGVRELRRFPPGTPYTEVVTVVAELAAAGPLRGAPLVVDQTAVGGSVVDLLRRAPYRGRVVPVTITAGHTVTVLEDGSQHVPKKELVTCLQLLLQGRRLKVARQLADAALLEKELVNFRAKVVPAGSDTLGAWREGQHDDLVLAVALACWLAEREPRWGPGAIGLPPAHRRSPFADPPRF